MTTSNAEGVDDGVESETEARTDGPSVSTAMGYVRRAAGSGALAGVAGGVSLFQGLRAIRRGDRGRGLVQVLLGALFVAVAAAQRRSADGGEGGGADADPAAVADTSPDIGDVGSARDDATVGTATSERRASGDEPSDVVDTSPDIEDVDPGSAGEPDRAASGEGTTADTAGLAPETDTADDETAVDVEGAGEAGGQVEEASYERLGEAAFDEHGREVPVPQRAFDQRVLSLGDEAFWGIRESDDAVVVTELFDSLQERKGVRYVASSRIDEERTLQVPDVVTNHWDEVAGGGIAVAGGTDLVFALAEDAEADDQLLVVPEQWADDVPGLGGGDGEGEREERGTE